MDALRLLADVPLAIEVELGRPNLTIRDLLALEPGSLVVLGRAAGENLDVRVAGALIGYGELVLTDVAAAVRITDFRSED